MGCNRCSRCNKYKCKAWAVLAWEEELVWVTTMLLEEEAIQEVGLVHQGITLMNSKCSSSRSMSNNKMRRAGGGRDQGQYGQGGGYGQGMGGGPTSWEGMYDDVPQPNVPTGGGARGGFQGNRGGSNRGSAPPQTGPQSAPPANAPTGPKNAGK